MPGLPAAPEPGFAPTVRATLDALEYCEAGVLELSALTDPRGLARLGRSLLAYRIRGESGCACLCRLFLLETPQPRTEVELALGRSQLELLQAAGLLQVDADRVAPLFALRPWADTLLVSDLRDAHQPGSEDFVLGPGPVARLLAGLALPGPHGRVLDLGTGCGVLACQLAGTAGALVATDLSARSAAIARFNAALNGTANIRVECGDLFAPVAGEQFELVLCNPPMVLAPEPTYLYRDGGSEICARIAREVQPHLTSAGCLQMLCNWRQPAGADWRTEPLGWIEGLACDAWLLRFHSLQPDNYADLWLRQQPGSGAASPADIQRWVEHLRAAGAASVGGGLLVLRPQQHRKPIRVFRDAPAVAEQAGPALAQLLAAHDCLAQISADTDLLALRLVPVPGLQYQLERRYPSAGTRPRQRLQRSGGLGFSMAADANLVAILALLDGSRTLGQAALAHADRNELQPDRPLASLPAAARELLRLGLLVPA